MRRLLPGYVLSFNLRHRRSGHLFQNRYKSILCQEDAYLLELAKRLKIAQPTVTQSVARGEKIVAEKQLLISADVK
jgi:DNA-binding MarR family transcriptional regulator